MSEKNNKRKNIENIVNEVVVNEYKPSEEFLLFNLLEFLENYNVSGDLVNRLKNTTHECFPEYLNISCSRICNLQLSCDGNYYENVKCSN